MPYLHHPQFVPKQQLRHEKKAKMVYKLTIYLPAPRPGPKRLASGRAARSVPA